jgi:hypothetical protein
LSEINNFSAAENQTFLILRALLKTASAIPLSYLHLSLFTISRQPLPSSQTSLVQIREMS